MDMTTAIFAANKAKADLETSGRVGYKTEEGVIFHKELAFQEEEGVTAYIGEGRINLVVGESYNVAFTGSSDYCICKKVEGENGNYTLYLGNGMYAGGEDTGEPFVVIESVFDGKWSTAVIDTNRRSSCIINAPEIVHTIDPKYLPNQPVKVDLAEYGLDVITLFAEGGGVVTFDRNRELLGELSDKPDSDVVFVIKNDSLGIYLETQATKTGADANTIQGLSAYIPLYLDDPLMGGAYSLCLLITALQKDNVMLFVQKLN